MLIDSTFSLIMPYLENSSNCAHAFRALMFLDDPKTWVAGVRELVSVEEGLSNIYGCSDEKERGSALLQWMMGIRQHCPSLQLLQD